MAQLVLAAAGAAIGAVTGIGPATGWAIGSALGGALFSKSQSENVEGSKLDDLRVTGTEYGQCIPYVFGSPRIAGQIWWASDRRQIAHTSVTSGGKGGGGSDVTTTTYTYDVDLLIGLTDNEIDGIVRIWINGKLVYNLLGDPETVAASISSDKWDRLTVYTGSTSQLPDPTYEAAVGTPNAVAYRGRAYVFIQSMHLGPSGAIPNLTFEKGNAEV